MRTDTAESDTAESDTAESDTAESDTAESDTAESDTGFIDEGVKSCDVMIGGGCALGAKPTAHCDTAFAEGHVPREEPGRYEGTGCAVLAGPQPGLLLVLLVLLRRIAWLLPLMIACVHPAALALDTQALQNTDGGDFLSFEDANVGQAWAAGATWTNSFASMPVVLVHEGRATPVLPGLFTTELAAWWNLVRILQIGVVVPMHGVKGESGPVRGDTGIRATLPLVTHPLARIQSAWTVQVDLATGSRELLLGDGGAIRGALSVSAALGRAQLGGSLGIRLKQMEPLPGSVWGRRFEWAVGSRMPIIAGLSTGLEAFGSTPAPLSPGAPLYPLEAIGTLDLQATRGARFRLGGGSGVGQGVGAPRRRILAALEVRGAEPRDSDEDGLVDARDLCRFKPEDRDHFRDWDGCPDPDNDRDGWVDPEDGCPDDPEVFNSWRDSDGCPDALVDLVLRVRSRDPGLLERFELSVDGADPVTHLGDALIRTVLPPGEHPIQVSAPGHHAVRESLRFEEGGRHEVTITLIPIEWGHLTVSLVDEHGQALEGAVAIAHQNHAIPTDGRTIETYAGRGSLTAASPGYDDAVRTVFVPRGGVATLEIALTQPPIAVVDDRITLADELRFGLDNDQPLPGSDGSLRQLAEWLVEHPEVELLRIEGHADELGSPRYNYGLSQRRAVAIRDALVALGIEAQRLDPIGSGEVLVRGDPHASRRVGFLVVIWRDPADPPRPPAIY